MSGHESDTPIPKDLVDEQIEDQEAHEEPVQAREIRRNQLFTSDTCRGCT